MKLTNTLMLSFKSIQLPKLNTNLLSMMSLIVLCAMVFVAVDAFASDCEDLENRVKEAQEAYDAIEKTLNDAKALVIFLKKIGASQEAIDLAEATVKSTENAAILAILNLIWVQGLLLICKLKCLGESDDDESDDDESDSGSCDSGSCG